MVSMKIVAISDVHIKYPHDEADKLLLTFLNHPKVAEADYILLLGDIFDLMVGPHKAYLHGYAHLFNKMTDLHKAGKKIYFFEGNHDVHLERLFRKIWPNNEVTITQKPIIESIAGKKYYFSHGDEHEVDNLFYHRYISFIRSKPLKFFADHVMPYSVLNFFGERASKMSRKKGSRKFDMEGVRAKFRSGVQVTTKGEFDFVLGGHSHVQDEFKIPGAETIYLNNGYALKTGTFILVDNHKPSFVQLS
jgi:UDP-2,3-diacylglucosamine hydrolase